MLNDEDLHSTFIIQHLKQYQISNNGITGTGTGSSSFS
jgi:hypothetical protein